MNEKLITDMPFEIVIKEKAEDDYPTEVPPSVPAPPVVIPRHGPVSGISLLGVDQYLEKKTKVVSVTITGNAEATIARALASVADVVDECIVIDTGITDDTLLKAVEAVGAKKLRIAPFEWTGSFSDARNFALDAAQASGANWAVVVDSDEWLHGPLWTRDDLHRFVTRLSENSTTVAMVQHDMYSYAKERIIRIPRTGRYEGPTHEAFVSFGPKPVLEGVMFGEEPKTPAQLQAKFARDRALLEKHVEENPNDQRWWYYLGDTLENLGELEKALDAFVRCGSRTNEEGWDEEGAWAWYRAATLADRLKRMPQIVLDMAVAGLRRHPGIAELAWYAAYASFQIGRMEHAVAWSNMAIALGEFQGCARHMRRVLFSWQPGLYEKPFEVLRFAYIRMGENALAAVAEDQYQRARRQREQLLVTRASTVPVPVGPEAINDRSQDDDRQEADREAGGGEGGAPRRRRGAGGRRKK